MKTILKLNPDEIKQAIKYYVAIHFGPVKDMVVELDYGMEMTGYGMGEREEPVFRGASVTLIKETI